jgi:hypothetical protein
LKRSRPQLTDFSDREFFSKLIFNKAAVNKDEIRVFYSLRKDICFCPCERERQIPLLDPFSYILRIYTLRSRCADRSDRAMGF